MSHLDHSLQEIWTDWRECQGPCSDCPHWGTGGGKAPFFGVDSTTDDTEVMIIADEPGNASDPIKTENVDKYIQTNYPEEFSDKRHTRIEETGMYEEYSNNWEGLVALLRTRGIQFYYTNLKKCRETNDGRTTEAIQACSGHLSKEIDALDPSVIITLGGKPTKHVYDQYPTVYEEYPDIPAGIREAASPSDATRITKEALNPRQVDGMTLIPSVHFSKLVPNLQHVPWIPDDDGLESNECVAMYWARLIELTSRAI